MAEKRTTADAAGTTVPSAHATDPEQPGPSPTRARKANPAATSTRAVTTASAAKGAKPAKAAKSTKAAKAAPSTRAAKSAKPSPSAQAAPSAKAAPRTGAGATGRRPTYGTTTGATEGAPKDPPKDPPRARNQPPTQPSTQGAAPAARSGSAAGPDTPAGPATPGSWTAAVREAVQHPDQPPHRLAALVVAELGPRAAAWAGWLRATYPDAPARGIARLAAHEADRHGWALGFGAAGGPVAAALCLPAAAWARATVVLRVAAAHGHDPTDPRRAGELLTLLGAGPGGAGEQVAGLAELAGRSGLVRSGVARLGLRGTLAATALGALAAAGAHRDGIARLAHRAARFYATR